MQGQKFKASKTHPTPLFLEIVNSSTIEQRQFTYFVRSEFPMVMTMKITIFWDVSPRSLVENAEEHALSKPVMERCHQLG
jgi:hypothetical protein